jgi:hypothetical protein
MKKNKHFKIRTPPLKRSVLVHVVSSSLNKDKLRVFVRLNFCYTRDDDIIKIIIYFILNTFSDTNFTQCKHTANNTELFVSIVVGKRIR